MIDLDTRTKIVIAALISTASVFLKNIAGLSALLLLTLIICKFLSVPIYESLKKLRKFSYVFFALIIIQSIFIKEGHGLLFIGDIKILTTRGLEAGISIMLRMAIIILSAMIIASSGILKITYGLIAMKLPYEIAYMVLLAMKFLPLFKEEFEDSLIAVQLAGADLKKIPIGQKLSLYSYILTPSVMNSLKRARYISAAMELRGFRAYPKRTAYSKIKMKNADYGAIFITASIIVFISIMIMR